MCDLKYYTTKFVEGMEPLAKLIPGRALAYYVGTCCKRLIEPHLLSYEVRQEAKRQQELFKEFPLKRLEMCDSLVKANNLILPEASIEAFDNAMKIGDFCLGYINGDESCHSKIRENIDDDEWFNRFIDNAKYVSNEDLQRVWGRLLKEKYCQPEKVNKRVLNILCNLDANELKTIEDYLSYFKLGVIPNEVLEENKDLLEIIYRLMGLGLVMVYASASAVVTIGNAFILKPDDPILNFDNYSLIVKGLDKEIRVEYTGYHLTVEGEILCNLIDKPLPQLVADAFVKMVKDQAAGDYEYEFVRLK